MKNWECQQHPAFVSHLAGAATFVFFAMNADFWWPVWIVFAGIGYAAGVAVHRSTKSCQNPVALVAIFYVLGALAMESVLRLRGEGSQEPLEWLTTLAFGGIHGCFFVVMTANTRAWLLGAAMTIAVMLWGLIGGLTLALLTQFWPTAVQQFLKSGTPLLLQLFVVPMAVAVLAYKYLLPRITIRDDETQSSATP